jgi:hypothetical protein
MNWFINLWQEFPPEVQTTLKWVFDEHLGETLTLMTMLSPLLFIRKIAGAFKRWKASRNLRRKLPDYTFQQIERGLKYYIWPECQSVDPSQSDEARNVIAVHNDLCSTLDRMLRQDAVYKHFILLADSGMGKTSFLLNYFARHLHKLRKPHQMELVPLNVPGLKERLDKINNKNDTVLLLDAFDEDTEAIKDHASRLAQIMAYTRDFYRILITCRTQFFPRDEEIPVETGILKSGPRELGEGPQYIFYKIYLSPFNEEQVSLYLKRRFPWWRKKRRKMAKAIVDKIPNLAVRPMLLAYVDDLIRSGKSFTNSYQIYEEMVDAWLEREKAHVQDKEALRTFSNKLAVDLFQHSKERRGERIPYTEIDPIAKQFGITLATWQLAGRSLLNRDALGNYKFAHRSILEFLVAKHIIVLGFQAREFILNSGMTDEIISFIKEGYGKIDWKCPLYFVPFKGGCFKFQNQVEKNVKPFEIAIFPVTNSEYEAFDSSHREKRDKYSDQDNQPVVNVSWDDANKYCEWLGKRTGIEHRLPTEAEWEYAASGGGKREYPWGNEPPTPKHANYNESEIGKTTPVGSYAKGKTPEGLYDMAGNVWEWCQNWFDDEKRSRVLRGGAFGPFRYVLHFSGRFGIDPTVRGSDVGFRVVRALQS